MTDATDFHDPRSIAEGVLSYARHLQRCGVAFLPRGNPETGRAWLAEHGIDLATGTAASETEVGGTGVAGKPEPSRPSSSLAAPPKRVPTRDQPPQPPVELDQDQASPYPPALPLAERESELTQLAQTVSQCTACPELACARTQTVFGEGNPAARVCFFGEAPGADEDRQGRPFVGRAGQLLTKMIEACTLKREDVYILNTLKCRPPGNRNPLPEEIDNCRGYFERQLDLVQPEYIVCMGLFAAQTLLHSKASVGKLRGRFHAYKRSRVLVTYHPAYLLRNPSAKRLAWEDLQRMMSAMGLER